MLESSEFFFIRCLWKPYLSVSKWLFITQML